MGFQIAIDGPAGAGKSTIARLTARKLSFIYVDTGAMYRAIAVFMLQKGIDVQDREAVASSCRDAFISIEYRDNEQNIILNGENITHLLRRQEVGDAASFVSSVPEVRAHLLSLQRTLAEENNVVMDGRDIGTTILPDAQVKIFLTASAEIRAKRRFKELKEKNLTADYTQILEEIKERDHRDMTRETSPLRQADDAYLLDSSELTIEEVADRILEICRERQEQEGRIFEG